ncbi:MAG: fluoride efflux transporter CrcB [Phyllobacteriaceae bacterium]|nr:fluoride efflux transporter CrcB [Phyllobacteriaceae bacterium]
MEGRSRQSSESPMPLQLKLLVLVFLGGGFGSSLRYGVTLAALRVLGAGFPWGTFLVNVIGSTVMGAFAGYLMTRTPGQNHDAFRLFFMTGILGGFTTFSAYSLDTVALWERGATVTAIVYAVGSVVLSLAVLTAALVVVRGWSAT